ncbi:VWA domain-containing protein [Saccharopolyspora hirsuta]|uniref:VWA domain-containing protein n=1 Tax=Saccharopolyspora hirsuta TaxID=1837 RepID=A0A5M7B797_SACHI|nr:VWA domain-containing protein [Saccharopolyspora hirsuta]KAA5825436.1 VWA domain-containing protein [Saccharopolyspora hirsuta]
MATHIIADPTTAATTIDGTGTTGWISLSAAITDEAPTIADREDLLVTIAPGAGHGAPACFLPNHATIEIDGTHLGTVDPASAAPHRISDRARYATAWGLLTHECAHARHSQWDPPEGAPPGAVDAAMMLEESRIEAAQIRRRPDDRHWLRASATNLILADTLAHDPTTAPALTPYNAARAAGLLMGRADAGILLPFETEAVERAAETALGAHTLAELRKLWQAAQRVADDEADTMLELGRAWCELVGTDPTAPPPDATSGGTPAPSGAPSSLAEAINAATAAVAANTATEPAPTDPATTAAEAHTAETTARKSAEKTAARVFASSGPETGHTEIRATRAPSSTERAAARQLARALSTAALRDRTTTKTTSPTPPGRLRMRGALATDAQRAAGALPTAEPFTRTHRRIAPAPPLRLGIACDVSGSMSSFAGPVASAAWILAHAAHHTPIPATTATVIFGRRVRPITYPGTTPAAVTEFDARDNYEDIPRAIDALDGALSLHLPGAARLLVIVSDGNFRDDPRAQAQRRLDRLRATGCAILWLTPDHPCTRPMSGATIHPLTDPTTTAQAIGRAATTALRTTR